jgi:two-component system sensor kinase FixL
LPQISADRVQIETVLHNLLANAIDALKLTTQDQRIVRVGADQAGAQFVRVSVADNGPGISTEMADQLFHPFTTSKPRGMGLGLAMSRSMVEAHGGRLALGTPANGCELRFTIPVAT